MVARSTGRPASSASTSAPYGAGGHTGSQKPSPVAQLHPGPVSRTQTHPDPQSALVVQVPQAERIDRAQAVAPSMVVAQKHPELALQLSPLVPSAQRSSPTAHVP